MSLNKLVTRETESIKNNSYGNKNKMLRRIIFGKLNFVHMTKDHVIIRLLS